MSKSLSVITVNFNNLKGLEKTIQSVFSQSYNNYEYIIIDGGSTDGSKELLESYSDKLAYWVSEKDGGIYDAMNKGIKVANGTYLQFLNSGDTYVNENSLKDFFEQQPCKDIVYADYLNSDTAYRYYFPSELSFRYFYTNSLNHQATLIKLSLFQKVGLYKTDLPIIADWDFFIRSIFLHEASTQYISTAFINFDFKDSMSNKPENMLLIKERRNKVLNEHFPLILKDMQYIDMIHQSSTFKLIRRITLIREKLGI